MYLNSNFEQYEEQLIEIENQSIQLGITDPIDPRMSQIFYLYGLIEFKKIENTFPFSDITEQFKKINEFLTISLEICEDDNLLIKIYSLIGDLYSLVDQYQIAELSYLEAIKKCKQQNEIIQLYCAILQLRIVFLIEDGTIELFNQVKKIAFENDSKQLDLIFKMEEEYLISIKDNNLEELQKIEQQNEQKWRTGQKYQQLKNLGVFGSYKKKENINEIMN